MTQLLRYAENVTYPDIRPIIAQASYDYNGWYGGVLLNDLSGRCDGKAGCA